MSVSGAVAGCGDISIQAINVPVTVTGMDVSAGEIVHMNVNGACKFPADRAEQVLKNARALEAEEQKVLRALALAKSAQEVIAALVADAQYGDYHSQSSAGRKVPKSDG